MVNGRGLESSILSSHYHVQRESCLLTPSSCGFGGNQESRLSHPWASAAEGGQSERQKVGKKRPLSRKWPQALLPGEGSENRKSINQLAPELWLRGSNP